MFYLLALLSASYWYCLPLIRQRLVGYSEFRLYDVVLAVLISVLILRYRLVVKRFFQQDAPGKWLMKFCIWASITYVVTVIWSLSNKNTTWVMVSAIYLFHLWGFVLAYAAFRIFIRSQHQCLRLLDLFLLLGAVEALLICLQSIGVVPRLWGSLYDVYGTKTYSGTLGPNRVMPGISMVLLLVVAAGYWRNVRAVGAGRLGLALFSAGTGLLALGVSGSRTAWVVFATFCLLSFAIARRRQAGILALGVMVVVLLAVIGPASIKQRFIDMYRWKLADKLSQTEDSGLSSQIRSVDAGRVDIWKRGAGGLLSNPWLIPFGAGFNNRYALNQGDSPHNMYLTLVTELGLLGLYLYLQWLRALWFESRDRVLLAARATRLSKKVYLPVDMKALLGAMIFGLVAGELLYVYRPTFSLFGIFLFVCAILNHPAMISPAVDRLRRAAMRRALAAQHGAGAPSLPGGRYAFPQPR
jgi:O-antigen ligase